MCSIEWLCCLWPWATFKQLKPPQFLHFA